MTELLHSPEISQTTLSVAHPYRREDAAGWIGSHGADAEAGTSLNWAICDRGNGALTGAISLEATPYHRRGMLGYWLGAPSWNRGVMGEAARAVADYAFTDCRPHRVQATCMSHNVDSSRVMERAGLPCDGTLRGYYRKGDGFLDAGMYALVHED